MRTANDGRGDETWGDPAPGSAAAPDDDATRVMSRADLPAFPGVSAAPADPDAPAAEDGPAAGGADETAVFSRDPGPGEPAGAAQASATRAFTRPPEASATRGSVRGATAPEPADPVPARPRRDRTRPAEPRRTRPAPRPRRRRLRLRWIITAVLLTVLALPPATWGWVWYTARQDDRAATDAIVVLGASQYNGVPSPVFEARLRHAQVLYLDGVAPMIVTVGGKQPGDNYTEAAAGRNWLIEVGIPSDRIIAVEEGSDTLQSIRAVSLVFTDNDWDQATLVSDPWHSLRSKVMASDHGIDSGTSPSRSGPAVIERRTQLWYITRETASLWYYWIFNDSSDIRVNAA
ncbi:hypothetical protein SUDANB121_01636 [Nocardiopsis dassonvillei]|uniref:YdcF family protein n=1 Tax=Nocardiopsis dassonvillei TaxID=2014 RepID=UPI003F566978